MGWLRYIVYFFGIAGLTALLTRLEVAYPGTLRLHEFVNYGDVYGTSEFSPVEIIQLLILFFCGLIIGALLIAYCYRHRKRMNIALARIWPSPGLTLIFAGAVILFAYSILVGHEPLWQSMLGEHYNRIVKLAVEEFIELIGYFLWFVGTIEYAYQAKAIAEREPLPAAQRRREYRRRH
jgi:hypothetical protein